MEARGPRARFALARHPGQHLVFVCADAADFKREILNEIARCLNMPRNVTCGDSSGYNYASGRLDHQTYYKAIRVDQDHMAGVVLDRVLAGAEMTVSVRKPRGHDILAACGQLHLKPASGAAEADPAAS